MSKGARSGAFPTEARVRKATLFALDGMDSGKLELGWVATDARSPMFIFNVDSAAEVQNLLGSAFLDQFKMETHPIMSFEELAQFFVEQPPGH